VNDTDRRSHVNHLIAQGTDLKRFGTGTEEAYNLLILAYELAHRQPKLPEPWLSITAYRLAHLIMRRATTKPELDRANMLFEEASRLECLGPLPFIYRIAVLFRLKSFDDPFINQKLMEAYKKAMINLSNPAQSEINPKMQTGFFNMLELSSYMAELPYKPLEGLGSEPYKDIYLGSPTWFLVGRPSNISDVVYPKEFAFKELHEREKNSPNAVFFKLSADSKTSEWRLGSFKGWEKTSEKHLYLLALLLKGRVNDKKTLVRLTTGSADGEGYYRHLKSELQKYVLHIFKDKASSIYERATYGSPPKLLSHIEAYGAIEEGAIKQWQ
jgi:hypothetical protein